MNNTVQLEKMEKIKRRNLKIGIYYRKVRKVVHSMSLEKIIETRFASGKRE